MKEGIAAVTVLYMPAKDTLSNILSYAGDVDRLYIVDNGGGAELTKSIQESLESVSLLHYGSNCGISDAYNLAIKEAVTEGYSYLMTMDQDSRFKDGEAPEFIERALSCMNDKVAIVAPIQGKNRDSESGCRPVYLSMSSGSVIDLSVAERVGGFDERLFIDEVDHDFCLRVKDAGYDIYEYSEINLQHRLGNDCGWKKWVKCYPPDRVYYMVRNYLYIRYKHGKRHKAFLNRRGLYLFAFLSMEIMFGGKTLDKVKMFIKGVKDAHNLKRDYRVDLKK